MTVGQLGEYPLVQRICERLQRAFGTDPRTVVGLGDDAAVVSVGEERVVLTVDTQLEGVHFRRHWMPPFDLGWKAIAISLSDIAAMGARPLAALLAIGLKGDELVAFVDALYEGAVSACQATGTLLLGGDTTRSPDGIAVCSVVLGLLEGPPWTRQGAQVGDDLILTGTVGDAAAGLWLLENGEAENPSFPSEAVAHCLHRFRRPTPRFLVPRILKGSEVHAAIDISDGLVIDAGRLAMSSGVAVVLDLNQLPLSDALRSVAERAGQDPLRWALRGGEDYELLLAVASPSVQTICAALHQANVPARVVGKVIPRESRPVLGLLPDGTYQPLSGGFQHFP